MQYFNEKNEVVENYALALFEVAQEENKKLVEIIEDLETFNYALKNETSRKLYNVLYYPSISVEEKIHSIHEAFDGNIDELVIDFVITLTSEQRLTFLSVIIEEVKRIYRKEIGCVKVIAKFGVEPSLEDIKKIQKSMQTKLGCNTIEFEYLVDNTLIGGVQLFYNGKYIDNTLASKIKRYAKQICA